jgi:AraC-like DNA-binding protein
MWGMVQNAVDWTLFCIYQLKPDSLNGVIKIIELPNMQISRTDTFGALMYDFVVPEGCINLSILDRVTDKSCIDQMKLQSGMIAVIDDLKIYNYMHNSEMKLFDISLKKGADPLLLDRLARIVDKYYIDTDEKMARLMEGIINSYANKSPLSNEVSVQIEKQVTEALMQLTEQQEAREPHFTKSEKAALAVKTRLFKHMDGEFTTETLAREHGVSSRSLQQAFKSLYGFTPNQFIRLLKLNLVHHELIQAENDRVTVSRVAHKWGFKHLGRFACHYKVLFGEAPSVSLKRANPMPNGMHIDCVARKEEI